MRYIINFQVKIIGSGVSNETIRSSYTILEEEVKKFDLSSTQKIRKLV